MRIFVLIYFLTGSLLINGQSFIHARYLQVTMNKTTNLIFPASISSVDRGSERIVVQKSTANILRVKADTLFTDTTNLTVITGDGKLYSFLVSYAPSPAFLNLDLGASENIHQDTALLSFARTVMSCGNYLHGVRFGVGKVWLSLGGIYTNGQIIAVKLRIENGSPFSFEIGRIRAVLGALRSTRRRAVQENEIAILLTEMEIPLIRERQAGTAVILLPKSGLKPGQSLAIHIKEKGGERDLLLTLSNRFILNAFLIP